MNIPHDEIKVTKYNKTRNFYQKWWKQVFDLYRRLLLRFEFLIVFFLIFLSRGT